MKVLGIESSCDETGVALVRGCSRGQSPRLLAHALHSQVDMHQAYGGVVPELASRDHIRRVLPLTRQVLAEAGCGLQTSTWWPTRAGRAWPARCWSAPAWRCALAAALDRPAIGVHHLEGHLLSPFLSADPPQFPFIALLVSGGHTQLMRVEGVGDYALLGETIDDAAGEAFDKSAKLLGLGYPGGPALARAGAARRADRPSSCRGRCCTAAILDFSFAGLKTAVLTQVRKLGAAPSDAAACRLAAIDAGGDRRGAGARSRCARCAPAASHAPGGGRWRGCQRQPAPATRRGVPPQRRARALPRAAPCSDNGAMIALAAAMRVQARLRGARAQPHFDVRPRWGAGGDRLPQTPVASPPGSAAASGPAPACRQLTVRRAAATRSWPASVTARRCRAWPRAFGLVDFEQRRSCARSWPASARDRRPVRLRFFSSSLARLRARR